MSDVPASGRLEDRPFAVLAGAIFREGLGGELRLASEGRERSVWFVGGNPVAVVSQDPREHVAQALLEHGKIGADDAARLAALPETREGLLGADFIPKDLLNWGIKYRFVNLCYDLFKWEQGDFSFAEGPPPRDLPLLKIPANTLIVKGVGYMARHVLAEALPDEGVLGPVPPDAGQAPWIGPEERSMLDECTPGRSVGELLAGGWDDTDRARQLLYALRCLGLVELSGGVGPAEQAEEAAPGMPAEFDFSEPVAEPEPEPFVDAAAAPEPLPGFSPGASLEDQGAELSLSDAGVEPPAAEGFMLEGGDEEPPSDDVGGSGFSFGSFDEAAGAGPSAADEEPGEGGGSRRRFSLGNVPRVAWLGAAAVLIGLGAGAWFLFGGGKPSPVVAPPVARVAPQPPPPTAPAPAPAPPEGAPPVPPPGPAVSVPTAPAPEAPPSTEVPPTAAPEPAAPPPPPAAAEPPAATAAPTPEPAAAFPSQPLSPRYRSGLEVFKAGDLDAAAAVWESLLAEEHARDHTILAATLCEPESIRTFVGAAGGLAPVFLVSKQVSGRACYRVALGTFRSKEEAQRALAAIPEKLRTPGAFVWPVAEALSRGR